MFEWALQQEGQTVYYRFDERIGVLQRNNESSTIPLPSAQVLGVLLSHADSPVTPEDVYESMNSLQSPRSINKSINELKRHPAIGEHILQVGNNKQAVYSFLTSPQDSELLLTRMNHVHEQMYGEEIIDENGNRIVVIKRTSEAEMYKHKIQKVAAAAAALATAVTVTYAVVRHVRKK